MTDRICCCNKTPYALFQIIILGLSLGSLIIGYEDGCIPLWWFWGNAINEIWIIFWSVIIILYLRNIFNSREERDGIFETRCGCRSLFTQAQVLSLLTVMIFLGIISKLFFEFYGIFLQIYLPAQCILEPVVIFNIFLIVFILNWINLIIQFIVFVLFLRKELRFYSSVSLSCV